MSRRRKWGTDSTVVIDLSDDAEVSLTFRGNLFDLAPDERTLIADLTDIVARFKEARLNQLQAEETAAGA